MRRRKNSEATQEALTYLAYRTPMRITELYIYCSGDGYYTCPRCQITLEREFASYCDRCGQCLNWTQYKKAKHIHAK